MGTDSFQVEASSTTVLAERVVEWCGAESSMLIKSRKCMSERTENAKEKDGGQERGQLGAQAQ